jgi:thioredoxin reductase (NADPH)
VPEIEKFTGTQLFYRVRDPSRFHGKSLVIVGGGDSALDWTLDLVGKAESVVLVHRRDGFRAAPASVAKMRELCDQLQLQFLVGQVTGFEQQDGRMAEVRVTSLDGLTRRVPLDMLLVFFGLSPKLGPIAEWGLDLERKQILVDTEKFETNVPGIFAVGDINTYPGKKKLILSGFHEAALAAFGSTRYIFPAHITGPFYTVPPEDLFAEIARILANRPRFLVVDRGWWDMMHENARMQLSAALANGYRMVGQVAEERGPIEVWRRD